MYPLHVCVSPDAFLTSCLAQVPYTSTLSMLLQQVSLLATGLILQMPGGVPGAAVPVRPQQQVPTGPRPVVREPEPGPPWRGPPPQEYRGNEMVARFNGPLMSLGLSQVGWECKAGDHAVPELASFLQRGV
jgi:hypothetical protein